MCVFIFTSASIAATIAGAGCKSGLPIPILMGLPSAAVALLLSIWRRNSILQ
jgi:hypothetical protein